MLADLAQACILAAHFFIFTDYLFLRNERSLPAARPPEVSDVAIIHHELDGVGGNGYNYHTATSFEFFSGSLFTAARW